MIKVKQRLLTGLQPSGDLTIGNYSGSIRQVVEFQKDYEVFLFVPDMHSITVKHNPELLRQRIKNTVAMYIACGIDVENVHIYLQSENLYHANLSWVFECHSYFGELSRMTQFKSKGNDKNNVTVGLFTYPTLMAADILMYDPAVVPVGTDQVQHVELTRNIAKRFNNRYGETFVVPEYFTPEVGAKIKDLQNPELKMSKSTENLKGAIFLNDSENDIRKRIMSAKTDSENKIYFDEENKPGISNLLTIFSVFSGRTMTEIETEYKNSGYGELKQDLANLLVEKLGAIHEKYLEVLGSELLDKVLDEGRDYSLEIASKKYEVVSNLIGFGRI